MRTLLTGQRMAVTTLEPMLEDLHARLSGVVIECLDWADFLARYDSPDTLFYLGPPYWGCEGDYGRGLFGPDDFAGMAEALTSLKGRFLMSINDRPEIRSLFASFRLQPVEICYTIGKKPTSRGKRGELLIGNFHWPAAGGGSQRSRKET